LIALIVAIAAAFFGGWQAWVVSDTEQRQLRAYVSSTDPVVVLTKDTDPRWMIFARWINHGSTPTRFSTVTLTCLSLRVADGAIVDAQTATPTPALRDIPPNQSQAAGSCSFAPDKIASNSKNGLLAAVQSRIDYVDVFEKHHQSEQCYTVAFLGDPSVADNQHLIGFCGRNCEDEECGLPPVEKRGTAATLPTGLGVFPLPLFPDYGRAAHRWHFP
jgi:hypothetical protein